MIRQLAGLMRLEDTRWIGQHPIATIIVITMIAVIAIGLRALAGPARGTKRR